MTTELFPTPDYYYDTLVSDDNPLKKVGEIHLNIKIMLNIITIKVQRRKRKRKEQKNRPKKDHLQDAAFLG